jgi:hypothetical protein
MLLDVNYFKMKIRKKAQLKTQEMAFMLLAVILFFIIAGLFLIVIKYREMYQTAGLFEKEKVISTISKLADTAEFSCDKTFCIDTDKLIVMQDRTSYSKFWPVDSLSIRKVFPKQAEPIPCTETNYPDCNLFEIHSKEGNINTESTYISLCRKEQTNEGYWYEKCELGEIIAGFEKEEPE